MYKIMFARYGCYDVTFPSGSYLNGECWSIHTDPLAKLIIYLSCLVTNQRHLVKVQVVNMSIIMRGIFLLLLNHLYIVNISSWILFFPKGQRQIQNSSCPPIAFICSPELSCHMFCFSSARILLWHLTISLHRCRTSRWHARKQIRLILWINRWLATINTTN